MQRRQFLILSGSTLTGVLLSQCATPQTESNASSATVLKSKNGLLEVDLDIASNSFSFGGKQGNLLSYNGQIPGPRLEIRPGDQVRIHAKNRLSAYFTARTSR